MRPITRCAVAVLLLAAGCGGGGGVAQPPTPAAAPTAEPTAEPTAAPAEAPSPTSSPAPTAAGADEVLAYYVRDAADRLWVEPERRQLDEPTLGVARAAMEELLSGEPRHPELVRPADAAVLGVDLDGSELVVDVSEDLRAGARGGAAEEALQQALVHTATQFDGVETVRLLIEGEPVEEVWGHLDWSQPIEPDPFALSPIVIMQPEWGETVATGDVEVSGTSNTFEATMMLRLLDASGAVAEEAVVTATCGSGCRGDFSHTFPGVEAGNWTIEAEEPDPSGGEGRPPFIIQVQVEVR